MLGRFFHSRDRAAWPAAALSVLLATSGITACNLITGADGLLLGDSDGDGNGDGDDDDTTSSTTSTGNVGGAGGGTSTGGGTTTTTSSTTTSTTTSGSGGGGQGGNGQGAGPTACDYPDGPYGVGPGQTVPPTLSWQGYAPGSNSVSTITSEDFFDCDGSRGIDAILIDTSQFG